MIEYFQHKPLLSAALAVIIFISGITAKFANDIYQDIRENIKGNSSKIESNKEAYASLATIQAVMANDISYVKRQQEESLRWQKETYDLLAGKNKDIFNDQTYQRK